MLPLEKILESFSSGFNNILTLFQNDPSMWWLLAPILLLWTVTEIYYGEYQKEKIGFHSAFTSAFSLLWVGFIALRALSQDNPNLWDTPIFWVITAFMFYGLFVMYVAFKHSITERTINIIVAPSLIYFLSLNMILFGIGKLTFDLFVILDLFLIFATVSLLFFIIKRYLLSGFLGEIETVKKAGRYGKK